MNVSWLPQSYNIQVIFDDQITKEKRQISLTSAMERIGEPAYDAHDALNDARNTVCVCLHLDMAKGLANYASLQNQMKAYRNCESNRSKSSKTYATRESALSDPDVINFYCPSCGENVVCRDFVRQNSDKYICIGICESGDEMFVRFKFTKWSDGNFTVSRILYEMNEDNRNYYLSKKHQAETAEYEYQLRISTAV